MTEILSDIQLYILDPARFPVAVLALVVTAFAGLALPPLTGNANPFLWVALDRTAGELGARLDRRERAAGDLMTRGLAVTVIGVLMAALAGWAAGWLAGRFPLRGATAVFFLSLALTGGIAWRALARLPVASETAGKKRAWYVLARSSRTDFSAADDYTASRSAMGFAARSLDKGAVAPVFWFLIGGLPACYVYAGLAALSWRFGRDGFGKGFGRAALTLEMPFGIVPHAVTGILLSVAGLFTPRGGLLFRPLLGMLRRRAPYAEGGLAVTAAAHALGVTLGGPVQDLDGRSLQRAWVGPDKASAKVEPAHLKRALYLVMMAYLLLVLSLVAGIVAFN